jgi:hypothetical protein
LFSLVLMSIFFGPTHIDASSVSELRTVVLPNVTFPNHVSRGNMYWLDVLSDDGKVAIAQVRLSLLETDNAKPVPHVTRA